MSKLADGLSRRMDRPVLNKTGLGGEYDVEIRWTADPGLSGAASADSMLPQAPDVVLSYIARALKEDLGLRLESKKSPIEILIIDHIESPSEN